MLQIKDNFLDKDHILNLLPNDGDTRISSLKWLIQLPRFNKFRLFLCHSEQNWECTLSDMYWLTRLPVGDLSLVCKKQSVYGYQWGTINFTIFFSLKKESKYLWQTNLLYFYRLGYTRVFITRVVFFQNEAIATVISAGSDLHLMHCYKVNQYTFCTTLHVVVYFFSRCFVLISMSVTESSFTLRIVCKLSIEWSHWLFIYKIGSGRISTVVNANPLADVQKMHTADG